LNWVTPSLPVAVVKKYLPRKWIDSPQLEHVLAALQQGDLRLNKAGVNGRLSQLGQMTKTGLDEHVGLTPRLHDVGANFSGGYLPLRGIQGRIALDRGLISFAASAVTTAKPVDEYRRQLSVLRSRPGSAPIFRARRGGSGRAARAIDARIFAGAGHKGCSLPSKR